MMTSVNRGEDRRRQMLMLLADGKMHSGTVLANALGVSRTAVSNYAKELAQMGVELHAARGNGYRLDSSMELLDQTRIENALTAAARAQLRSLQVHFVTDSTNQRLIELPGELAHGSACAAELQTAGRGRRGRRWFGVPGQAIFLSLAWRFPGAMQSLAGLSLAVGVCVQRALIRCCGQSGEVRQLKLKWPNDIVYHDQKLGGVLVEVNGEMQGPCVAVVGVGINLTVPESLQRHLQSDGMAQAVTGLDRIAASLPSRNVLVAGVLSELLVGMGEFESRGFAVFVEEWKQHDALRDRAVTVEAAGERVVGVARGTDETGALLLDVAGNLRRVHGGEVSVRARQ
ncbi:MAG: biotin--[acetyl-CoA-carboxylase] ligase [Gammaproteobacteria bacterium]